MCLLFLYIILFEVQPFQINHHNLNPSTTAWLSQLFSIPTTKTPPKYLGIQFKNGRNSSHMFVELMNRLNRKSAGWITKCVNQADRFVLIITPTSNHVTQTQLLPTHIIGRWTRLPEYLFGITISNQEITPNWLD